MTGGVFQKTALAVSSLGQTGEKLKAGRPVTACYGDLHVKIQWCQGNKGNKEEESNPRYVTKEESTREGERVKDHHTWATKFTEKLNSEISQPT